MGAFKELATEQNLDENSGTYQLTQNPNSATQDQATTSIDPNQLVLVPTPHAQPSSGDYNFLFWN